MEMYYGIDIGYFLWSLLLGIVMAVAYDILRVFRKIIKNSTFAVNVEDIIFLSLSAGLIFLLAYDKNNGQLRWQGFIGVGIGFISYRCIFKSKVVKLFLLFYESIMKLTIFMVNIVLFPVRIAYKLLSKPIYIIGWYTSKGVNKAKMVIKTKERRAFLNNKCKKIENINRVALKRNKSEIIR